MKIINAFVFLVCKCSLVFAQTEPQNQATPTEKNKPAFGIQGGASLTTIRPNFDNESTINVHAGVFMEKRFQRSDYGWQVELNYSKQGTSMTTHYQEWRLNYVQLPVLFNMYSGRNVVLQLGGYGAYLVKAVVNDKYNLPTNTTGFFDTNSDIGDYFKPMDAGLCIGLRLGALNKVQFGFRYNYGLADINKKIIARETQKRLPLFNSVAQLAVSVRI